MPSILYLTGVVDDYYVCIFAKKVWGIGWYGLAQALQRVSVMCFFCNLKFKGGGSVYVSYGMQGLRSTLSLFGKEITFIFVNLSVLFVCWWVGTIANALLTLVSLSLNLFFFPTKH